MTMKVLYTVGNHLKEAQVGCIILVSWYICEFPHVEGCTEKSTNILVYVQYTVLLTECMPNN